MNHALGAIYNTLFIRYAAPELGHLAFKIHKGSKSHNYKARKATSGRALRLQDAVVYPSCGRLFWETVGSNSFHPDKLLDSTSTLLPELGICS